MEVILRANVDQLGKVGEVVKVASGYARNYLIPKDLAYPASAGNLKRIESEKKHANLLAKQEKEAAEKVAASLAEVSLTFQVKVGEEDKLYGSVTSSDIATEAARQGHDIDKRKIQLEEPIKTLGVFSVPVKLHPEVTAEIKVWVVKE